MIEKTEQLQFTCPKCGEHNLQEAINVLQIFPIKGITDGIEFDYGNVQDGHGTYDAIDHYACADCGYIVGDGHIKSVNDMIQWIKENCG